jgi:hypothetical protein
MTGAGAKTATEDEDAMASEAIINEFYPAKGKKRKNANKPKTNLRATATVGAPPKYKKRNQTRLSRAQTGTKLQRGTLSLSLLHATTSPVPFALATQARSLRASGARQG